MGCRALASAVVVVVVVVVAAVVVVAVVVVVVVVVAVVVVAVDTPGAARLSDLSRAVLARPSPPSCLVLMSSRSPKERGHKQRKRQRKRKEQVSATSPDNTTNNCGRRLSS